MQNEIVSTNGAAAVANSATYLDSFKDTEKKLLQTSKFGSSISNGLYNFSHSVFNIVGSLFYPNQTEYEKRSTLIVCLRLFSSFFLPLTLMKVLQVYYGITNFMLILSISAIIPYFHSLFSVIKIIPCPRMAALVSNSALIGAFVGLCLIGVLLYKNFWMTYIYIMSLWPWLGIATVLARLHIGRDRDVTNLSPFVHLPILAFLAAGSWLSMLYCLKSISVTDAIVLCFLDPIWTSLFHLLLIRRIPFINDYAIPLILLIFFVFLYIYGVSYSGGVVLAYYDSVTFINQVNTIPVGTYCLFLTGRAMHLARCSYIKRSFLPVDNSAIKLKKTDEVHVDGTGSSKSKFKSLFPNFPFPIRFRLDVIFDSGLVEDIPHAVGPTGTRDIFLLTENLYLLPLTSIGSWLVDDIRNGTLFNGLSVLDLSPSAPSSAVVYISVIVIILSVAIIPFAASKVLFDRGSSPTSWVANPIVIQTVPYLIVDWLYLNPFISRFQIVCVVFLGWILLHMRSQLWLAFKNHFYKSSMVELEFLQPSCLRSVQKQVLHEASNKSGVEDFGALLFETAIHHGNNIRGYLQADGHKVWNPKPSACAAWKLAGSLVIRALRVRKHLKKETDEIKHKDKKYMESVVDFMVDSAADYRRNNVFRQYTAEVASPKQKLKPAA